MKEMVVTISKDGEITIDMKGFEGDECLKDTKRLEDELGIVNNRERKPDYYKKVRRATTQRVSR